MFSISEASSFYNRGETELRCVFADEGGDALLEFDRIEGDYRIELNGEIIGESGKTGYPQAFRVRLKEGENRLCVKLKAYKNLEALKKGVFVSRFEEQRWHRNDYHGLCMAAVRKNGEKTVVHVSTPGIKGSEITI